MYGIFVATWRMRPQQMRVSGMDMCAFSAAIDIDRSQRPIKYAAAARERSTLLSVKSCSCMAAKYIHHAHMHEASAREAGKINLAERVS